MAKWRKKPKGLWSPAIYNHEWPTLIKAMKEAGLHIQMTDKVCFFYGEYEITGTEIRRVWELSPSQLKKLKDRIIRGEWDDAI
tara:strand:+ start:1500 stop:1748 length:249 start_codon:yes stop_codon:yes gene_type:complete